MTHFTRCGTCGKTLKAVGQFSKFDVCQCESSSPLLDTGAAYWNYFGMAYELGRGLLENVGKVERYVNGVKIE